MNCKPLLLAAILCLPGGPAAAEIWLSGRVETPAGRPAEGSVALIVPPSRYETARRLEAGRVEPPVTVIAHLSGGTFRIRAPHPGDWWLHVDVAGHPVMRMHLQGLVDSRELPTLNLPETSPQTIRILDSGGRPFPGALVSVRHGSLLSRRSFLVQPWVIASDLAVADAEGRVEIRRPSEQLRGESAAKPAFHRELDLPAGSLTISAWGPGHLGGKLEDVPPGEQTLRLARARDTQRLRVVDPDGEPVAGVLVQGHENPLEHAWTDTDGSTTVAAPPGEVFAVSLEAERFTTGALVPAERGATFEITLPSPRTVTGKVRDAVTGTAITGALVGGWGHRQVQTDRAGNWQLEFLGPGEPSFDAVAAGYLPARGRVGEDGEPPDVTLPLTLDLALEPAVTLCGRVTDAAGKPVAGAEVTALQSLDSSLTRTAADGSFQLRGLPADTLLPLRAEAAGLGRWRGEGATGTRAQPCPVIDVVLGPGRTVQGRLVGPGGKPVVAANLRLRPVDTAEVPEVPFMARFMAYDEFLAVSDESGRFAFRDVQAGRFDLVILPRDLADRWVKGLDVRGEGPVDLGSVVLEAGVSLTGRVVDEQGKPVGKATVATMPAHEGARWDAPTLVSTRTDADGRFSVPNLRPGVQRYLKVSSWNIEEKVQSGISVPPEEALTVTVQRRVIGGGGIHRDQDAATESTRPEDAARTTTGRRSVAQEPSEPGVSGVSVSGRVVDAAAKPVAGAHVVLRSRQNFYRALSSADGGFRFEKVPDGEYRLWSSRQGFARSYHDEPIHVAARPVSGIQMRLSRGRIVTGRFLGVESPDFEGARVWASRQESRGARGSVDSRGVYVLGPLSPGLWTITGSFLSAEVGGPRIETELLVKEGGEQIHLDLDLAQGSELFGRVLRKGEPVPGVEVSVGIREPLSRQSVTTDSQGRYRIYNLPVASYYLSVRGESFLHLEELEVTEDRLLDVELGPPQLSGIVRDAQSGQALAGVEIRLPDPQWVDLETDVETVTDETGRFAIEWLLDGPYLLEAKLPGYRVLRMPFEVRDQKPLPEQDLRLERQ